MWIYYYCPKTWRTEESVSFKDGLQQMTIIPDATFTLESKYYFLEVDRTQSMVKNRNKIETYSKLNPLFHKELGHTPTVVFYTLTNLRKQKLKEYCQEYGVTCQVYTKEDIL
jgi:hypothetical protein